MREQRRRRAVVGVVLALVGLALVVGVVVAGGGRHRRARSGGVQPARKPSPGSPSPISIPGSVPAGPPAHPAPRGTVVGASVNGLFNARNLSLAQIDAQLGGLEATGATVARSDALWEAIEPVAPRNGMHDYRWSFDDEIAAALARHHMTWLPILDYTAPWAGVVTGPAHPAPASASAFAAFAAAFASRYGPGGSFWTAHPDLPPEPVDTYEIWNEPDNTAFWSPHPDATAYTALYLSARDAIEAIDPGARVIVGGLTNPGLARHGFLAQMLDARADLRGHVDGVAIHPYSPRPAGVLARVREARTELDAMGLGGVPLYVTEVGWYTRPADHRFWAPESVRPAYIAQTIDALGHSDCTVAAVVLYTWISPERNPADENDWYGISPPAGRTSRDVEAFTAGTHAATGPGREVPVCSGR